MLLQGFGFDCDSCQKINIGQYTVEVSFLSRSKTLQHLIKLHYLFIQKCFYVWYARYLLDSLVSSFAGEDRDSNVSK